MELIVNFYISYFIDSSYSLSFSVFTNLLVTQVRNLAVHFITCPYHLSTLVWFASEIYLVHPFLSIPTTLTLVLVFIVSYLD